MKDLRGALIEYSRRCEPVGSETLRDRVVMELVGGARTRRSAGARRGGRSRRPESAASRRVAHGWAIALIAAVAAVAAIAIPALLLGGGDTPRPDVATTVPPDVTTTVPPDATTTVPSDTTTTVPPDEEQPSVRPGYIQGVPEGASCAQLAEAGYTYPEVVAYWMRWERPEDSVPEIAAPCSDHFITEDIEAVYGPDHSLEVRIVSRKGGVEDYTFTASGPAVDAGLICPSGTVVINIWSHNYYDYGRGALFRAHWRWDDEYTCDDGTGTFVLGADEFIDPDDSFGVWSIVSGTGRYEGLAGGGGSFTYNITEPGPPGRADYEYWWSDVLEGRLWVRVDQPEG